MLLNFDLESLPDDAQVQNAQLRLFVLDDSLPPNTTVTAYPLLRDWDSGVVNWTEAANGELWSGSGASGPEDRAAAVGVSAPLGPASHFSLDLTDLVRDWLADPESRHGILLSANSEAEVVMYLASFEHSVTDWRPRLEITLAP